MPAQFAQAPRRSLGTSGDHHVPDLSPSIDPAIFASPARGGTFETSEEVRERAKTECYRDPVRRAAFDAVALAKQQGEAARHGSRQIHGDPTLTAVEKHRRVQDFSTATLMPAADPLEKVRRTIEKSIGLLRTKLAAPDLELSDVRAVEIRSKIAGLKPSDRFAAVSRAISRGDDSIVAAVLGSDRLLTDFLSDLEVETLRVAWARQRFPDEVALLSQRESDLSHIEKTGQMLTSYQRSCAGPPIVAPPTSGRPSGSPYGTALVGGIAGAARRASGG
jgi:hypothetical protein